MSQTTISAQAQSILSQYDLIVGNDAQYSIEQQDKTYWAVVAFAKANGYKYSNGDVVKFVKNLINA